MASTSLKILYNDLLSGHREQYKHFIEKSDLINHDGSINEQTIVELVKYESKKLSSAFCDETINYLTIYMEMCMRQNKWDELACYLLIQFYMIHERMPYLFVMRMAHDGVFRIYCKYLHFHLAKS